MELPNHEQKQRHTTTLELGFYLALRVLCVPVPLSLPSETLTSRLRIDTAREPVAGLLRAFVASGGCGSRAGDTERVTLRGIRSAHPVGTKAPSQCRGQCVFTGCDRLRDVPAARLGALPGSLPRSKKRDDRRDRRSAQGRLTTAGHTIRRRRARDWARRRFVACDRVQVGLESGAQPRDGSTRGAPSATRKRLNPRDRMSVSGRGAERNVLGALRRLCVPRHASGSVHDTAMRPPVGRAARHASGSLDATECGQ